MDAEIFDWAGSIVSDSTNLKNDSFICLLYLCRYDLPWGNPGPRDYYITGVYDPTNKVEFKVDDSLWDEAMLRDTSVALDVGAFYASKTFLSSDHGRVLWGWLPEERPSDGHGEPYGWAGAMSLPRQIIPYRNGSGGTWLVRTPPIEEVLESIRTDSFVHSDIDLIGNEYVSLGGSSGQQVEVLLRIDTTGMQLGDECGVRVLSSLDSSPESAEYTDIALAHVFDGEGASLRLSVDPSNSCWNSTSEVNRTISSTAPLQNDFISDPGDVDLRVIVDHSVVESFLAGGRRVVTRRVYPSSPEESTGIQLFSKCFDQENCGVCRFTSATSWSMRSTSAPLDDDYDSSSSSDSFGSDLKAWEIALVILIPVVAISAIGLFCYCRGRILKDGATDDLLHPSSL